MKSQTNKQSKKRAAKKPPVKTVKKKESAVRKIFKTTDGNLGGKPEIKKPASAVKLGAG